MGLFDGKVALVTGGNSGIGLATCMAFSREGAKVMLAARRKKEGQEAVAEIRSKDGEAEFVEADVSKLSDVENMVTKTIAAFGRLDYAFNNAGRPGNGATTEFDENVWDSVIDTNLKGVWLCMKFQIPEILKNGGAIVNNSSVNGIFGDPLRPVYSASKHGVIGLTKSTALEYAQRGIRINAVCPGVIETPIWGGVGFPFSKETHDRLSPLHPMMRVGSPKEVADAVIWLCSDGSSFITGHALPVDGGQLVGNIQSKSPVWPLPESS